MLRLEDALEEAEADVRRVILELAKLAGVIYQEIPNHFGLSGGVNPFGEKQTEIDVWANELIVDKLLATGLIKEIATEELNHPIKTRTGLLSIVIDPVDGSKNLDANNLIGTIVGIYRNKELPAYGSGLEAALYFLYGPYLQMILALDHVHRFVRSTRTQGFHGEEIKIPTRSEVYGMGGNQAKWTPAVQALVDELRQKGLKERYGGSLVGDFNQVLTYGGLFGYPAMIDAPQGKLRLQFECNPMAFIAERAKGRSSDGHQSILNVTPSSLGQRTPVYLGAPSLIDRVEKLTTNLKANRTREESPSFLSRNQGTKTG